MHNRFNKPKLKKSFIYTLTITSSLMMQELYNLTTYKEYFIMMSEPWPVDNIAEHKLRIYINTKMIVHSR